MRKFNTEGPIIAEDHYHVRPLERVDLDEILELIRDKRYFVMHAPRQTGKTSALLALRDLLDSGVAGDFRCVYVNVEAAQGHAGERGTGDACHSGCTGVTGALGGRRLSVRCLSRHSGEVRQRRPGSSSRRVRGE